MIVGDYKCKVEVNNHGGTLIDFGFAKVYDCLDGRWRYCMKGETGTFDAGFRTLADAIVKAELARVRPKSV